MIVCYTLFMPGRNSWDGKWSSEGQLFAKVVAYSSKEKANRITKEKVYSYDFGDGWRANVTAEHVDAKLATKIRRKSGGFCGYDWMIKSIEENGAIKL